jgi:NitT/TauT family transport system substrate-binding protein
MARHKSTTAAIAASLLGIALVSACLTAPGPVQAADVTVLAQRRDLDQGLGEDASRYIRMRPWERSAALSTEVHEIRVAKQFGLVYLPLMVMRQLGLIEKNVSAQGLGSVRVSWARYPSGKAMNDALQAGLLDYASGGIAPLLRAWDKTRGSRNIQGVAGLGIAPYYLNTVNPKVRTLEDFSERDRIALPAKTVSVQAILLQMAAARQFGANEYDRFDALTVSMSHPEALAALLSANSEITAHLTTPPYQYQELAHPKVRAVLTSHTVLGGLATMNALWTREEFYNDNPKTFRAVYDALVEAMITIEQDPRSAAEIYVLQANSSLPVSFIEKIITDPQMEYTVVPKRIMKFANFMHRTGAIQHMPDTWQALFFPPVHSEEGS